MWVKVLLLFFVFSFLFRTDSSFDQDLGRHLRIGEIIWQTKAVPLANLFSYTYPEYPFINSHWLFELLVYLGAQSIGLTAVLALKILAVLTSVLLILKTIPKKQYLILPLGFLFLHTLRERPELRPEILSFLFTAVTLYVLHRFTEVKTKLIYGLPFIQLLWVNSHIYFIIGIILQGIFLTHLGYEYLRLKQSLRPEALKHNFAKIKLLLIIIAFSLGASLLNPSGLKGFLNPFLYGTNYGYTIVENQTMFLLESINFSNPNFLFVKISFGIILMSFIVALLKKNFSVKNFALAGFGMALALMNVRSFPYLFLISFAAVAGNFGAVKWGRFLFWITIPVLFIESFYYLNGDYYKYTGSDVRPKLEFKESGKDVMNFVLVNDLLQPIFNNFDIGSYITYRGWPKYKIFVDGRPGEYPKEFFQQVYIPMQSDPRKFEEVDKQYGFKTIIFSHTDQTPWAKTFLASIVKNPEWKTVYLDGFMIVLVKTDYELEAVDPAQLNPSLYSFKSDVPYLRLALFLFQAGYPESAQKFAQTGVKIFPQSPLGNALFGVSVSSRFWW